MMAALPVALALALAAEYAPGVAPDTVVTFADQESALHPLTIHDNDTGRSYEPDSRGEAERIATTLIVRLGHSTDLGIMQVNSANLVRYDLTIHDAFDPGLSMRAGARILADAWQRCAEGLPVARMTCAASTYNSGTPNGSPRYAARIFRTAQTIVPSIRSLIANFPEAASGTSTADTPNTISGTAGTRLADPDSTPAPPGWDVFASSSGPQFVNTKE